MSDDTSPEPPQDPVRGLIESLRYLTRRRGPTTTARLEAATRFTDLPAVRQIGHRPLSVRAQAALALLRHEVDLLAGLNHPLICRVRLGLADVQPGSNDDWQHPDRSATDRWQSLCRTLAISDNVLRVEERNAIRDLAEHLLDRDSLDGIFVEPIQSAGARTALDPELVQPRLQTAHNLPRIRLQKFYRICRVDDRGFIYELEDTRTFKVLIDTLTYWTFEERHSGGNDAASFIMISGGTSAGIVADETPLGFRRYGIELDPPLRQGQTHTVSWKFVIDTNRLTQPQLPFCAVAVVRPIQRLDCRVEFHTARRPTRVESVIAPTDNWPLHHVERRSCPVQPDNIVACAYDSLEAHHAYGLCWAFA